MSVKIHLLSFEGCPNAERARGALRAVLAQAGLPARWGEADLRSPDCPEVWRGFPSPTVLVDGADVLTGDRERRGTSSCRVGAVPDEARIAAAVSRRTRSFASLTALPAAVAGLLPVGFCPACYPAWAGLLSALGLGAVSERVLAPLTAALLVAAVGGLAYQARRRGRYGALAAGIVGGAAMYAGQFLLRAWPVKGLGIALLIGASLWNILPRRRRPENCPACAAGQ
ncbi:MAG: hypothetical protein KGM24_02890 [Elusimicrobia bacterium]|nr:hypothetical protein [Elusimicrobiota bacterium]